MQGHITICGLSFWTDRSGNVRTRKDGCGRFCCRTRIPRSYFIKKEGRRLNATISMNRNSDFRRLYRRTAAVGPTLVTYLAKNRLKKYRVGITTSKKIGKAHDRNRAKRVIREAYRLIRPTLSEQTGWDIVFVARARTCACPMQEVYRLMKKQLAPCFPVKKEG